MMMIRKVWGWLAGSRWAGLAGKAGAYLAAFALLALVGSGRIGAWLAPPRLAMVGAAQAATAAAATAPSVPASAAPDAGTPAQDTDGGTIGVAPDGKVILNHATEEDLRRLPGIGPTRARAILALRARMKRFTRVEDLLKVKGIGRRSLARIRPRVQVD